MKGLEHAVRLGAGGLHCFPCLDTKQPTCPHGFKDASTNAAVLRDLWRRHPGPLVGVATGQISGIDVLDIDRKHTEAVCWWLENRHRIPGTLVHRTKSGGLHVLFQHRPGLRCWTARPVVGVDGRADGGYVIWWPAAGLPVLCDAPIAKWPDWFSEEGGAARPHSMSVASTVSSRSLHDLTGAGAYYRYKEAALHSAAERIEAAGEGGRNSTLNREAHGLCRLVVAGMLDGQRVADILAAAGIAAGLHPREVVATLRSAFRARGLA